MWERMLSLDRRWIFLAIGLAVVLPFVMNWYFAPGSVNPRTRTVFDTIETAKPGDVLMIAYDYGPASMPELHPMALALTRHALARGMRVLAVTLNTQGTLLADDVFAQIAKDMPDKKDGTHYANLGFQPGGYLVIMGMGQDIPKQYRTDAAKRRTKTLPVMKGIRNYENIRLIVDLASSSTPTDWILFANQKYKARVAAGVTAVMATDYYVYLDTGQLVGLINGLKGAAEYEQLLQRRDKAQLGMTAQSIAHLVILLFVLVGNIGYFATRKRRLRAGSR